MADRIRPHRRSEGEAAAEDLYRRMRETIEEVKGGEVVLRTSSDLLLADIRELLLHLVELVVLSVEEEEAR